MRLHWTPHAREDLFRLAESAGDPGSEATLLRGAIAATEQLQAHPRIGPAIDSDRIRKWPIAGTPCLILYMVREDAILLLRIVHNRSDWQSLS
ncbi:type II toxin-antitoxin system RelE/ParE family toxin [Sphingopyxis granuli]|jgi:plasmid stabilization system protein ParE|uniref:type II toxin-antitoxin system RelE/ParE family toxin n=1 Tax=Sphingopyxis granuli TaxID=267128 RepID=UPI0008313393|nr:type II toxin-antitoxin system RelE/ParE family toxin [Sphingopyxis granuli]QUM72469.1 type II toxin-antitoxin system RelE/ParE family toxin [Sphingopyxis granuli]